MSNPIVVLPFSLTVQWIHPSYRDLVIDELSQDQSLRLRFLQMANLEGIKLALSQAGGAKGERHLPLLKDATSWAAIRSRCVELVKVSTPDKIASLLRVLRSAVVDAGPDPKEMICRIISDCCEQARAKWDQQKTLLTEAQLHEFFDASILSDTLPVAPAIAPSWMNAYGEVKSSMADRSTPLDGVAFLEWTRLTALIGENEPRYLRQLGFPRNYVGDLEQLLQIVKQESAFEFDSDDADEILEEAERMLLLVQALNVLD